MEKKLTRFKTNVYFYKNGKKIEGFPPRVSGSLTGVSGNLSDVSGNLSGVRGDLTGLRGNLTGVRGYLSDCAITDEDRASGIDIIDLIDSAEPLAKKMGA